jgi:hypothetical protein
MILKADPILAAGNLHPLFCRIWKYDMIPTTWTEGKKR